MNETTSSSCQWCGLIHGKRCPEVKSISYYENGFIKEVVFVTAVDIRPAQHHHSHDRFIERRLSEAEKEAIGREYVRKQRNPMA